MNLEYSATASIEPERELAYLALVTPQDEAAEVTDPEPAVAGHLPTDAERTSTDTDVTLVDDAIVPAVQSPSAVRPRLMSSTSSVLGKRSSEDRDDPMLGEQVTSPSVYRNAFRTDSAMSERSDVTTEPTPPPSPVLSPTSAKSPRQEHQNSIRHATREMTIEPEAGLLQRAPDEAGPPDADVPQVPLETPRPGPPPLPPRRTSAKKPFMADAAGGGAMMFGKQHDVSECLDNCLFQIDAALDSAKLQQTNEHADSVVKECVGRPLKHQRSSEN
jgi:ubiquitin carboxyl-terminal hydrolase 25/28